MSNTQGINHLGLAVKDLTATRDFFVELLGWTESGYDPDYPRTAVSDGVVRLTLWQVDDRYPVHEFDRRQNIGLHHLALTVETEADLDELHQRLLDNDITIEFAPELLSDGPRKHMMCYEPGGIRIEFIWAGL
ncbi:VOC family protein [Gynuella sunshinyii]|uniref:Lactoylglutathione lyase and related lyase n=1 Tax=Gynuella sunshinyii YC6258 TaxID=1445510 RepID=A0A0C5VTR3_9GAMM|nr:VOC family protein [Gynuella sunshinyii]AJQ93709.1 lactoylglutathione lyase and related lyase [Gynuella sunshinyii YC6258]